MRFFCKRFDYVGRRLREISQSKASERTNNRKLARLVLEHHTVHHDLILINDFFKFYVGFNVISFFALEISLTFVFLLDIDWWFV